tara:strand:- start:342 stop:476 length:135 start_codon:yes stop_codon:yes gene_type:complete
MEMFSNERSLNIDKILKRGPKQITEYVEAKSDSVNDAILAIKKC